MTYRFTPRKGIFNGIFTYINRISTSKKIDMISITGSKDFEYKNNGKLSYFFPPTDKTYIVINQINASLTFTFETISINITGYSIKSTSYATRTLHEWTLEAKNNDSDWILLHYVRDCNDFLVDHSQYFNLNYGVYNSFRLTKQNQNSDKTFYFDLHGFEVFGQICNQVNCEVLPFLSFPFNNDCINKYNQCILSICYIFILNN